MTIVSVTYENEAILIKINLPYFSWVFLVVLELIYGPSMSFSKPDPQKIANTQLK